MAVDAQLRGAILQNILLAENASKPWHDRIKVYRNLYAFEQYKRASRAKKGEVRYEDPTYTNTVDLAVGILLANRMDFRAHGWNPDAAQQKQSSNIEKFLNGVLTVAARREGYDLEYENNLQFVRDGASIIYSVWDPKIAARSEGVAKIPSTDPQQQGSVETPALMESPLRVQIIDPLSMKLLPGGPGRWLIAVREEEMDVLTAEQRYGIQIKIYAGRTPSEKMGIKCKLQDYWEVVEIVDEQERIALDAAGAEVYEGEGDERTPVMEIHYKWRKFSPWSPNEGTIRLGALNAILVDQEFVMEPRVMQGYDDLPYTVGFFKPVSRTAPADWGHSIMHPMMSTVELLSRSINRRAYQLDVFSDLPLMAIAGPGQNIQIDPGIARIIKLQQGSDIKFPTWPGNPPDFEEHIGYLRSKVQQSSFSDVMLSSGAGDVSGYALSQLGDQNRIRLEQPVRHLALQWGTWAEKVLRLTNKFAGDNVIRVYGRSRGRAFADYISGNGIDEYMVDVKIQPEFPGEVARNHSFFVQTKGELSRATRLERYLHIEQPDDEEDKLVEERLAADPVAQQYAVLRQLKSRADNGDEIAQLMLVEATKRIMAGQEGRPEEPIAPPGMSGVQSSTGQPTSQEAGGAPAGQSASDKLNTMINQSPEQSA